MNRVEPSKELQAEIEAVAKVRLFETPLVLSVTDATLQNKDESVTKQMQILQRLDNIELSSDDSGIGVGEPQIEWLTLFGTALIQEKAGIAFRSASGDYQAGPFDPSEIIEGINRALASRTDSGSSIQTRAVVPMPIEKVLASIEQCVAENGAIAAAPAPAKSTDPNYWFCWQRDAGVIATNLTIINGSQSSIAADYFSFLERAERPDSEMAISRFSMDGKPIDAYGSPQLDGPAYTALMLLEQNRPQGFEVARPYLAYLCSDEARGLTYDAWEFAVGRTFHALNLGRKALRRGAAAARAIGDDAFAELLSARASELATELEGFWRSESEHFVSSTEVAIDWMSTLAELDIAVIGSVLFDYDVTDDTLNVEDDRVRATMNALERCFEDRWPVNRNWKQNLGRSGHGLGRFPEDMNDGFGSTGGNPWAFATLWGAQYYARLIERLDHLNAPDAGVDTRSELLERANGYLDFVLSHQDPASLTEQIDGFTGKPRGAKNLGWAQSELALTLKILGR